MKRIVVVLCLCFSLAHAQDTSTAALKYKVVLTYGIAFMQPNEINDHITISNNELGSSAEIIKSMPETAVMFSLRSLWDFPIITTRIGRMYITRIYDVSIPETATSSSIVGYTSGTHQGNIYFVSIVARCRNGVTLFRITNANRVHLCNGLY